MSIFLKNYSSSRVILGEESEVFFFFSKYVILKATLMYNYTAVLRERLILEYSDCP